MKKMGLIGFFNYGLQDIGGGVMKTRNFEKILSKKYGSDRLDCLDRLEGQKNPIKYFFHFIRIIYSCSIILLFPTAKMLKSFLPILLFGQKLFHYKIAYIVIGGWLPRLVEQDNSLKNRLKKVDCIYVENIEMKNKLNDLGNVVYMPNFSLRNPLSEPKKYEQNNDIFRFCTYSRITKEKGIIDAIDAITHINNIKGKKVCTLDIYGQVWSDFEEEFTKHVKHHSDCITYCGVLTGNKAIEELSEHYMLLFPSYYEGEGFPGTLVESFMSGLPVIANDWKYNSEIVKHNRTGLIYDRDKENLYSIIEYSMSNKEMIQAMRSNCINESKKYIPDNVLSDLFKLIEKE